MRTQLVAEHRQDADNLPALGSLQFAHLIVGLHYFGRLDEYRLARCRLVVNDTVDFAFQSWCHRNHQSAVAHRRCSVLSHQTVALGGMQNGVKCS